MERENKRGKRALIFNFCFFFYFLIFIFECWCAHVWYSKQGECMCDWCQTNSIFALLPWHLCLSAVHFIRSSLLVVRTQFLIGFRIQLLFAFAFNFGSLYLFFSCTQNGNKKKSKIKIVEILMSPQMKPNLICDNKYL